MTNQLIPRLRFKQFNDNYTGVKFNKLVKRISKHSNNTKLPRISFDNIISGTGVIAHINNHQGNGILFNKNDILFGKLRPYLKNWAIAQNKGIAIGDFWILRPYSANHLFIYYLIQTNRYNHVANITSGTKMPRSNWGLVSKYTFNVPSLSEQQHIGTFFAKLDRMIELQSKKITHLKQLKKGYLQKMFPQKGKNVPRLRFDGFHDEWNKKKLSNLANIKTGKSRYKKRNLNKIYPILGSTNIIGYDNTYDYRGNFILIARVGEAGQLYKYSGHVKITDNTIYLQYPKTNFLLEVLKNKRLDRLSFGSGRKLIKSSEIKDICITIPDNKEQDIINSFVTKSNQLISQQNNKLTQLKRLKKAYLQKMFI